MDIDNVVKAAINNDYVTFQKTIKSELDKRIENNDSYKTHLVNMAKYDNIINKFKEIENEIKTNSSEDG